MINLVGSKNIIETIFVLANIKSKADPKSSLNLKSKVELKEQFQKFLKVMQPHIADLYKNTQDYNWIESEEDIKLLVKIFNQDIVINDTKHTLEVKQNNTKEKLYSVLEQHAREDEEFILIFNLVTNIIFSVQCETAYGGTISDSIGVIWINPGLQWTKQDYLEMLVHELTHTLMFIDELRYRHYKNSSDIVNPKNFAISSILGRCRPLDKVIHSIVVATELLLFRNKFPEYDVSPSALHPYSSVLISRVNKSIKSVLSLTNIDDLITTRTFELLNRCSYEIKKFQ